MPDTPSRQLDPGTYDVHQIIGGEDTLVGHVYVEEGQGVVVEHWVLLKAYSSPTSSLHLDVRGVSGSGYASLSAYLSAMETYQTNEVLEQYVRADCFYYEQLPS